MQTNGEGALIIMVATDPELIRVLTQTVRIDEVHHFAPEPVYHKPHETVNDVMAIPLHQMQLVVESISEFAGRTLEVGKRGLFVIPPTDATALAIKEKLLEKEKPANKSSTFAGMEEFHMLEFKRRMSLPEMSMFLADAFIGFDFSGYVISGRNKQSEFVRDIVGMMDRIVLHYKPADPTELQIKP